MSILDAYAVIALLKGEPAAASVRAVLSADARLTSVGVAEVVDHLVRLCGASEDEAALDVAQLGLAPPLPVDADLGLRAGLLRARHYHRRTRPVSTADCVAAEAARAVGAPLATADPHLLALCRDEALDVLPLPGSDGEVRPT